MADSKITELSELTAAPGQLTDDARLYAVQGGDDFQVKVGALKAEARAADALALHQAGDETVTGTKTFAVSPLVPQGLADGEAVNFAQLQMALSDSGGQWAPSVQNLAALRAVSAPERVDGQTRLVQDLEQDWGFESSSSDSEGDNVVKPDDITSGPGRWLLRGAKTQNHESLLGLQGGGAGDHQHLTSAEKTRLPSANQYAALAGTGSPSDDNRFVTGDTIDTKVSRHMSGATRHFGTSTFPETGDDFTADGWFVRTNNLDFSPQLDKTTGINLPEAGEEEYNPAGIDFQETVHFDFNQDYPDGGSMWSGIGLAKIREVWMFIRSNGILRLPKNGIMIGKGSAFLERDGSARTSIPLLSVWKSGSFLVGMPGLRWNVTTGNLEYSHDGTAWAAVGSGSGGGGSTTPLAVAAMGAAAFETQTLTFTNAPVAQFFGLRFHGHSDTFEFHPDATNAALKAGLDGLLALIPGLETVTSIVTGALTGSAAKSGTRTITYSQTIDVPALEVVSGEVRHFLVENGDADTDYSVDGGDPFALGLLQEDFQANQSAINPDVISIGNSNAFVNQSIAIGGTPSASHYQELGAGYGNYGPQVAFNGITNDQSQFWWNQPETSGWLQYDLGSGNTRVATRYVIFPRADAAYDALSPRDFTFAGSNNGSLWTTLDTRTGIINYAGNSKTFDFSNLTAYRYYRLNVTASSNPDQTYGTMIGELQIFSSIPSTADLTTYFPLNATPTAPSATGTDASNATTVASGSAAITIVPATTQPGSANGTGNDGSITALDKAHLEQFTENGALVLPEVETPAAPNNGKVALYAKGNSVYARGAVGPEVDLGVVNVTPLAVAATGAAAFESQTLTFTAAPVVQFFGLRFHGHSDTFEFHPDATNAALKAGLDGLLALIPGLETVTSIVTGSLTGSATKSGTRTITYSQTVDVPALEVVSGQVRHFVVSSGDSDADYSADGGAAFALGISQANFQANQRAINVSVISVGSSLISSYAVLGAGNTSGNIPSGSGVTPSGVYLSGDTTPDSAGFKLGTSPDNYYFIVDGDSPTDPTFHGKWYIGFRTAGATYLIYSVAKSGAIIPSTGWVSVGSNGTVPPTSVLIQSAKADFSTYFPLNATPTAPSATGTDASNATTVASGSAATTIVPATTQPGSANGTGNDGSITALDKAHLEQFTNAGNLQLPGLLKVVGNDTSLGAAVEHYSGGTNGTVNVVFGDDTDTGAQIGLFRAGGTAEVPTAVVLGQRIASLFAGAFNGTQFKAVAAIRAVASEAHTTLANGTKLAFYTTKNGTVGDGALDAKMVLSGSGQLALGGDLIPDPSALFHPKSTTQGAILAPEMTTTQRNAMASPRDGLVIRNLTTTQYEQCQSGVWSALGGGTATSGGAPGALTKIASVVVGAGGMANVDFTGIPATYSDLEVRFTCRAEAADTYLCARLNEDSGTNYLVMRTNGVTGTFSLMNLGQSAPNSSIASDSGAEASMSGKLEIYGYAGTTYYKQLYSSGAEESQYIAQRYRWLSTAAVTSIRFYAQGGGDIAEGSVFTLYGYNSTSGGSSGAGGADIPTVWLFN